MSEGAYSDSQGLEGIRNNVAKYISDRDGYPSDPNSVYLTSGASEAIRVRNDLMHWAPQECCSVSLIAICPIVA